MRGGLVVQVVQDLMAQYREKQRDGIRNDDKVAVTDLSTFPAFSCSASLGIWASLWQSSSPPQK
jgi:hypothetical protein